MIRYLSELLHANPNLVFFVVLGLGYLFGKIKIRGFEFGPVAGVLFIGLIFGHYGFGTDLPVQSIGFIIFIFAVGMRAGPKFFSVIRTDGLRYLILAIVVSASGFAVALTMSSILGFEPGASAGILAGGLTSSPTLAAAQEAVRGGIVTPPEGFSADDVITNITTGYAITYIFGTAGLILFFRLLPRLMRLDFKNLAKKLENDMNGGESVEEIPELFSWSKQIDLRAYRAQHKSIIGFLYDAQPFLAHFRRILGKKYTVALVIPPSHSPPKLV